MIEEFEVRFPTWGADLNSDDETTVALAFHGIADALNGLRESLAPYAWDELIFSLRASALMPILLQEPLTRRSYHRPSGYPGDAETIDLICAQGERADYPPETTPLGRRLHRAMRTRPLCRGLRNRRRLAAEFLDRTTRGAPGAAILAIDAADPREIGAAHPALRGRTPTGQHFDAASVPCLFECLSDAVAGRTLALLLDLLGRGGQLMICNHAPDAADLGYMEAAMDWKLIARDEDDLKRLATLADPGCATRTFREPAGQVVILEMFKAR